MNWLAQLLLDFVCGVIGGYIGAEVMRRRRR
jgi:hypothetical protein